MENFFYQLKMEELTKKQEKEDSFLKDIKTVRNSFQFLAHPFPDIRKRSFWLEFHQVLDSDYPQQMYLKHTCKANK